MKNGCERTKNRMQTKLQPLGMDDLFMYFCFFLVVGGGGGGVGQLPKKILAQKKYRKKIMHSGPREKNRASLSTLMLSVLTGCPY